MATRISGASVSWGGSSLSEASELEFALERGLPVARGDTWTLELGQIRVLSFTNNSLPISEYGKRKTLRVTYRDENNATQTLWESDCIYEGLNIRGVTNDVWRFAMTFRVMDTTGAPSNP